MEIYQKIIKGNWKKVKVGKNRIKKKRKNRTKLENDLKENATKLLTEIMKIWTQNKNDKNRNLDKTKIKLTAKISTKKKNKLSDKISKINGVSTKIFEQKSKMKMKLSTEN